MKKLMIILCILALSFSVVSAADNKAFKNKEKMKFGSNLNPVADFTWGPQEPAEFQDVLFESTSYDDDGEVVYYAWDINNDDSIEGEGVLAKEIYHRFEAAGTYSVRLDVTDNDGATASKVFEIVVTELTASLSDDVGGSAVVPAIINLDCMANEGAAPYQYKINFDTGSARSVRAQSGFDEYLVGAYSGRPTWPSCFVFDSVGNYAIANHGLTLYTESAESPVAEFDLEHSGIGVPLNTPIHFTSYSYNPAGTHNIVDYSWDFQNDGAWEIQGEDKREVYYTFSKPGYYVVRLKVENHYGLIGEVVRRLTVGDVQKPLRVNQILSFPAVQTGYVPFEAAFVCRPDVGSMSSNHIVQISFGDSYQITTHSVSGNNRIYHTYTKPGKYIVECEPYGNNPNDASKFTEVIVKEYGNTLPVADFAVTTTDPKVGEPVFFESTSLDLDGELVYHFWDFENDRSWDFFDLGEHSGLADHIFSERGVYEVRLQVMDDQGAQANKIIKVHVGDYGSEPIVHTD